MFSSLISSEDTNESIFNLLSLPKTTPDNNFDFNLPEVQAAITRWIPQGATGLHACTDEPLNDSFPSRWFLVDYVYGASLAEAFYRHIPFAFCQNIFRIPFVL